MSRRLLVPLLVLATLSLVAPAPLLAHGGGYQPPGPPPPPPIPTKPGTVGPSAAPPGVPLAPAGAGLSSGSSSGTAPTAPAFPPKSGSNSGAASASSTPKAGPSSGQTIELASTGWQYWWECNKDQYLDLRSRTVRLSSKGYVAGHLTGRGRRADPDLFTRPDPALIRREVLPLLMRLLDEERDRDILDSSMLALARSADEDTAQFVIDALLPFLAHDDRVVQCAAALSLGVLGSPRAVPPLTAVMRDTSKGRNLARATGPLDQSVRACAALGLGLINEPDSVDALCALVRQTPDRDDDLKACAIAALGLTDNASSPQALTFLLERLGDRRLDPPIKSHVPIAIGRLCNRMGVFDPAVDRALLEAFRDRDTDDRVRQSLAIALGLVGTIPSEDLEQDVVLATLLDYCAEGRNDATREFCFIAVAQIGRRDPAAPAHPGVHQALRELFVRECVRPTVNGDRAWVALGAAIYGLERAEARPDLCESLIQAWSTEGDPSYKAAFALALGLLEAQPRAAELFADLQGRQDQELNGFTALALGCMRHGPASDTLRALCRSKAILAMYRTRLATALALLADDGADEALIALLGEGHAVGVCAAGAKALGLIGGAKAVTTLQRIAADSHERELARAFACVALGMICEKTALPWNARLLADSNFRSLGPTLQQVFEIL